MSVFQNYKLPFLPRLELQQIKDPINKNLMFDNVLAQQGSSFCHGACLNFQAFSLRDIKWQPEKAVP